MTITPAPLATDLAIRAGIASLQRAPRLVMAPKNAADRAVARHRRTHAA